MTDRKISEPGDEDLDLDIDVTTVTAVVVADRCIEVGLRGGFGTWVSNETGGMTEIENVTEADISIYLPEMRRKVFKKLVTKLERWHDEGTILRLCSAPGGTITLIEDRDSWIPFPRRSRGEE